MKKIIKKILFALLFIVGFGFTSCSYLMTGFFYVENYTDSDITDFTVEWDKNGRKESLIIDTICAKSKSDDYAVILNDSKANVLETFTSNFILSYNLNGREFTFLDSKTKMIDENGNVIDPRAKFVSDKTLYIEVFTNDYIITQKD